MHLGATPIASMLRSPAIHNSDPWIQSNAKRSSKLYSNKNEIIEGIFMNANCLPLSFHFLKPIVRCHFISCLTFSILVSAVEMKTQYDRSIN